MPIATTVVDAERQLQAAELDSVIKSVAIPPRPQVVLNVQSEMAQKDPDLRKIANLVSQDVGLTAAVLKAVNSPYYGLSRRADSVEQAVALIGLRQMVSLVTALAMRSLIRGDGPSLARFYDVSAKRAYAMSTMAKSLRCVDTDVAQTFGLFCDVGIPLLMQRFPDYGQTLTLANADAEKTFTDIEQERHNTDHALVGAMMARSWGLSTTVSLAIRLHHDYAVFRDPKIPEPVSRLIALSLVAEVAIQRFARMHSTVEWFKGGDYVEGALVLGPDDVEEWIERLIEGFAAGLE